jgi:hypothetical protein
VRRASSAVLAAAVCLGGLATPAAGALTSAAATPGPSPAAPGNAYLAAVACPSAATCVAAGAYSNSASAPVNLGLLLIKNGASWEAMAAPAPADAGADPGVAPSRMACASAAMCVVAGSYTDSAGTKQGLLLTGHGSSWTAVKAPLPPDAGGSPRPLFSGVACPSVTTCVAVGDYQDSAGHLEGLLLTGLGSTWTAVKAPVPPGAPAIPLPSISGVACPTATTCVAVGDYLNSAGNLSGLLLTGFGPTWQTTEVPLPRDADAALGSFLVAVTCPAAATCLATGGYNKPTGYTENMLLTGHGSSWAAVRAPLPANATQSVSELTELANVTCSSATACLATGFYTDNSPGNPGLLVTGHGSSWAAVQAPLPSGAPADAIVQTRGAACASARRCAAVGDYHTHADRHLRGLLLTGHGSSWTAVNAPLPSGAAAIPEAFIPAVACQTSAICIAVGSYQDSAGNENGLLLTSNGSAWTAVQAPLPPALDRTAPRRPLVR